MTIEKRQGGAYRGYRAESVTVTRTESNDSVVILFDVLSNDLDRPVWHVFYELDPGTAREIAAYLVANADKIEGK